MEVMGWGDLNKDRFLNDRPVDWMTKNTSSVQTENSPYASYWSANQNPAKCWGKLPIAVE